MSHFRTGPSIIAIRYFTRLHRSILLYFNGFYSFWSIFWSIPPAYFEREAAAAGIALINCFGALGGVFASNLLGTIKASQGRLDLGLHIVAGIAAAGAISLYLAFPKPRTSAVSLLKVA